MSSSPVNRWIKCVSTHGNVRAVAIQATELVRSQVALHQLQGPGAKGLGEALISGLLLGSYCKPGERVNLNVQGDARFAQALVDATPDGKVRGYVIERKDWTGAAAQPIGQDGFPDGPWGAGLMSVLRTKSGEGEKPYIGTVPLATGHLAKDLTYYWYQSEQVPSACGIIIDAEGGEIRAAGGFLIQAMPGASDAELRLIERQIENPDSVAEEFGRAGDPMRFLSRVLQSSAFMVLEEREVQSYCNCSWGRVERAMVLVGAEELKDMLARDKGASIHCDFCTKEYRMDEPKLQELITRASGG